jgi:tol-pal system protein YbgF
MNWRYLAPAAALAAAGCLASKGDIQLLQDEMRSMRAMQARTDSARRVQADSALLFIRRTSDSLRTLSQRLGSFQASVTGDLRSLNDQLITVQELTGQSQKRILDLRASLEERAQNPAAGDSAAAPGPAQLFQLSFDQLRRGSYGTARAGFDELLRRYPDFEEASAAQLYIAQSYAEEHRTAEADSVYGLVVTRFPRSRDAATALYKYGLSQLTQGKTAAARAALQRVVREYPNSTEAELARDRLRTITR